jgi:hypothetical protein
MTIDSSWIAAFKEESPNSFTKTIPFRPIAAFCDGQIRLMRGHTDDFMTWDMYIWQQFHAHVRKFYDNQKVSTVILAFDDYAHVPEAKCMTQLKRRRHLPKLEILEREPLPSFCPSGERWDQCIANRTFKSKVIAMVIDRLPNLLALKEGQTLIIDYAGCPKEFRAGAGGNIEVRELPELVPLGEADVKFTRYADLFKDLLVDSVDGDSIPIALLHHEACYKDLTMGSMLADDLIEAPPRICIYRITTRVDKEPKKEPNKEPKKRKAPLPECEVTEVQLEASPEKETQKSRRTFEYVNIPQLHSAIREVFAQSMGRLQSPTHSQHLMSMLLALIGLTGTDFTRNMPQLSGRSVFGFLPDLYLPLMRSYDPATGQLDVDSATDRLVACLYSTKYATHIRAPPASLHHVFEALHHSKLSQRTRDTLPSVGRVVCTVRNVNWLLKYWRDATCVPSPLLQEGGVPTFGFLKRNGVVAYST